MPKVIIVVVEFMFLGINIFWALFSAEFNPRLTAWAKMSLSRVENIFNTSKLLDQVQMRNKSENQTSSVKSPNPIFVSTTHEKVRTLGAEHIHYNTVTQRRRV